MGDREELHLFGSPLPELIADNLPRKRLLHVEEQVVRDENGLRRFHGAFTGGYSSGYWNTVGSQSGWKPQEFKSSRHEKAPLRKNQRPEDFMDDEDLSEFGIAPQRLQIQNKFAPNVVEDKRCYSKLQNMLSGVIPGAAVFEQLEAPIHDKIAIRILKSMGWRPGQGVGPRQSRKRKQNDSEHNKRERYLMENYGFQQNQKFKLELENEISDNDDIEITFAPDDSDSYVVDGKDNRIGLGYSGLCHDSVLGKTFGPMQLLDKKNEKQITISGQGFGVGALEEEDEDIFAYEDMTIFDFSVDERNNKSQKTKKKNAKQDPLILFGFRAGKQSTQYIPLFYKIDLPMGWKARNWNDRQSRFSPLDNKLYDVLADPVFQQNQSSLVGRHDLTPHKRAVILGEPKELVFEQSQKTHSFKAKEKEISYNKHRNEEMPDKKNIVENQQQKKEILKYKNKSKNQNDIKRKDRFKPFLANDEKQLRYEKFLGAELRDKEEINTFLRTLQPKDMSEWDCEMERKEFIQAQNIYKPLDGLMSQRFVSERIIKDSTKSSKKTTNKVNVIRSKSMWKPVALLCKLYNTVEPFGGHMQNNEKEKSVDKRAKISVFDYLEISVNSKDKFQTSMIIPQVKSLINQNSTNLKTQCTVVQEEKNNIVIHGENKPSHTINYNTNINSVIERQYEIAVSKRKHLLPQTELEKRANQIENRSPAEKQDLFKAIFESDDEDNADKKEKESTKEAETDVKQSYISAATRANKYKLLCSPPLSSFSLLFQEPVDKTTKNNTIMQKQQDVDFNSTVPQITFIRRKIFDEEDEKNHESKVYGPTLPKYIDYSICTRLRAELDSCHSKKKPSYNEWVEKDVSFNTNEDNSCSDSSLSANDSKINKKESKKSRKKYKRSSTKYKIKNTK